MALWRGLRYQVIPDAYGQDFRELHINPPPPLQRGLRHQANPGGSHVASRMPQNASFPAAYAIRRILRGPFGPQNAPECFISGGIRDQANPGGSHVASRMPQDASFPAASAFPLSPQPFQPPGGGREAAAQGKLGS